jgi:hypothetical protein
MLSKAMRAASTDEDDEHRSVFRGDDVRVDTTAADRVMDEGGSGICARPSVRPSARPFVRPAVSLPLLSMRPERRALNDTDWHRVHDCFTRSIRRVKTTIDARHRTNISSNEQPSGQLVNIRCGQRWWWMDRAETIESARSQQIESKAGGDVRSLDQTLWSNGRATTKKDM